MKESKALTLRLALIVGLGLVAMLALAATSAFADSRQIPAGGTGSPVTGGFTPSENAIPLQDEFVGEDEDADAGPQPFDGTIVDRSQSTGTGNGASVNSGAKAKSNPTFVTGFQGLNHYQQRYSRGGNQFSVEPPDQGLCVGNGYELEVVNDVLNVFDGSGNSVLPDNTATNIVGGFPRNVNHAVDLNSFYGYAPAINRTTGRRAQFVTDPSCIFDQQTQRWFVVALTLETFPNGAFTGKNHLDLAVSNTAAPTGSWTIYRIPVQDDGTDGTPNHGCSMGPCLGDYPHIGADANGIYLTTNEYSFFGPGFHAAQIYALSKSQLAAGAPSVNLVQIDTAGLVDATSPVAQTEPGFTVWPAQSPAGQFNPDNGGTEFFMSSNAGDEAAGEAFNGTSTNLIAWTLTNTASLDSASPSLSLTNRVLDVGKYGIPPKQKQPGSGSAPGTSVPQGFCINDTMTPTIAGVGCWNLLFGAEPAHNEVVSRPDSNDTRMQQVMYANGKLWGSLDTALTVGNPPANRAGIEWFIVNPSAGKVMKSGYLGAAGYDFTYPAIGVTASGRGVMAFTATGDMLNPSAAYASIDAVAGVGSWNVVDGGMGAAPDDGFTSYKSQVGNPPRTRWGDYGAASVDGNSVWIASEYIGGACNYTNWGGPFFTGGSGDNLLGTCGGASHGPGVRTALANWSTRISQFTP